jgi:hypothetical protein
VLAALAASTAAARHSPPRRWLAGSSSSRPSPRTTSAKDSRGAMRTSPPAGTTERQGTCQERQCRYHLAHPESSDHYSGLSSFCRARQLRWPTSVPNSGCCKRFAPESRASCQPSTAGRCLGAVRQVRDRPAPAKLGREAMNPKPRHRERGAGSGPEARTHSRSPSSPSHRTR